MRLPLAALAAIAVLSSAFTAPARAAVTQPDGDICSFVMFQSADQWTWVVHAGPIRVLDEDDPATVHTAAVTCALIDIADGDDYTTAAVASVTGDPAPAVAVLPPTAVTFAGSWEDTYRVCTSLRIDGSQTLYWDDHPDRNVDGRWSSSPTATCANTVETQELRPQDPPMRQILSAGVTAAGEADPVVAVAEDVICTNPPVEEALDPVWACGVPSTSSTISIVRTPVGALLRSMPAVWSCTDVHTGLPVTRGSSLAVPDPGVSCAPPAAHPVRCDWVQVSGYLAPTTLGRVHVTSACSTLSVTRPLIAAQGRLVEQWSGNYAWAGAPTPWRCTVDEDTHPAEPAYVTICGVLGSAA
jgi:hypothetical protein